MPIIPCVIIGSHKLHGIIPWLPVRRAYIWIAIGTPLYPPDHIQNRQLARQTMAIELQNRFVELYEQLAARFSLDKKHAS
jgi:hypothetical protein